MKYFTEDYLEFFKELAANNHKEWFDLNRGRYEQHVKQPMERFVSDLIREIYKGEKAINLRPSDCIFRINRDIRFAKDKSPYKLQRSALISREGKKLNSAGGFYVELGPEMLAMGGGAYQPDKEMLLEIREALAEKPKAFMKLVNEKNFAKLWGELQGERNKVLPKEFKEVAQDCPYIANKQLYYWAELDPSIITSDKLMKTVMKYYEAATPLRKFFEKIRK